MKVSRILLGSFLVLGLAACDPEGTSDPIDPTDPTTTTDPTDPTTTTDPSLPIDPTTTTDPTTPAENTISGTIIAPQGVTINAAAIGACLVSNIDQTTRSCTPVIEGTVAASGAYTLSGLEAAPYAVQAVADSDGNAQTIEYFGDYPQPVTPPQTGIDIILTPLGGDPTDPTATTDPSDPTVTTDPTNPTDPTTPTEGTVSGTVSLASGSTTGIVQVLACASLQAPTCPGVDVAAGSSFPYEITDLDAGSYYIVAQSDNNGNGVYEADDFVGIYPNIAAPVPVTTPASNVDFELITIGSLSSNNTNRPQFRTILRDDSALQPYKGSAAVRLDIEPKVLARQLEQGR